LAGDSRQRKVETTFRRDKLVLETNEVAMMSVTTALVGTAVVMAIAIAIPLAAAYFTQRKES
jgi:hypothetical protein